MTNQKMATVMQRSTLPTLYSVFVQFHFSDKFMLLLLTLLFVQPFPNDWIGWPLFWVASGRLPHMHIIWDFLLTHSPPIFLNLNKPLSHENHLLWSLLRFLCGSSERASVDFFGDWFWFDFDFLVLFILFLVLYLDGFQHFFFHPLWLFSPLSFCWILSTAGGSNGIGHKQKQQHNRHATGPSPVHACTLKGIAFRILGICVRDDTWHRKNDI